MGSMTSHLQSVGGGGAAGRDVTCVRLTHLGVTILHVSKSCSYTIFFVKCVNAERM